jgi:glycerate 2-kinase
MSSNNDYKAIAIDLFNAAVDAVRPHNLIYNNVRREGDNLIIKDKKIDLSTVKNLYVIGAGKATALMAQAVEELLEDKITKGIIIVKYGHACPLKKIITREAGHPIPDAQGVKATEELLNLVSSLEKNDLVICLISGGGSSLLTDLPQGSNLEDLKQLFDLLLKSGANIQEMNVVRKHISKVKGGNLAKSIYPAQLVSLILSDVVGDPLDVIASGPTVPDSSTFQEAIAVLKKYKLEDQINLKIKNLLERGEKGEISETPKQGDSIFSNTFNIIVGSNQIAIHAAAEKAKSLGLNPEIVSSEIEGEAKSVATELVSVAKKISSEKSLKKPVCLLMGGETTVTITGNGKGGRNQELALAAAIALQNSEGITILSGGTDGNDGPTDAAGAVVNSYTYANALKNNLNPNEYLDKNDSYHFFEREKGLLMTGPTLTNVMDIMIAIIE